MERPDPNPAASTQGRIRAVAADLFARRGYSGASVADIADGVGIQKASLYNYYASKEELLLELLEECMELWRQATKPLLAEGATFQERLRSYLDGILRFTAERPECLGILRVATTQIPGEFGRRVRQRIVEHDDRYREELEALFEEAVARGELGGVEPRGAALFWGLFVDGLLINQIFRSPAPNPYLERLPALWEMFWRGLEGEVERSE